MTLRKGAFFNDHKSTSPEGDSKMKKRYGFILTLAFMITFAPVTYAELLVDPSQKTDPGGLEVGGIFMYSDVDYEIWDIKRLIAGGYAAFGLSEIIDIYAGAGYIIDSDPSGWPNGDSGFIVAGGVRGLVYENNPMAVIVYSQLGYITEDYGTVHYSADGTLLELIVGGIFKYSLNDQLSFYGGLELIPYSDGEVDFSGRLRDFDLERDKIVTVRGGATYHLENLWFRGGLAVGSETTFTFGVGYSF